MEDECATKQGSPGKTTMLPDGLQSSKIPPLKVDSVDRPCSMEG